MLFYLCRIFDDGKNIRMGTVRGVMMRKKVVRQSLSEQAYALIIDKIRKGELKPGDRINIEEFAKEIGVSRTPMREAVNRLIQNGFLESKLNVGPSVAEYNRKETMDLIETNTILNEEGLKLVFQNPISPKLKKKIREIVEKQKQFMEEGKEQDFYLYSMEFHYRLIEECSNEKLKKLAMDVQMQLGIWVYQYQEDEKIRQLSLNEHQQLNILLQEEKKKEFLELLRRHNEKPLEFFKNINEDL